MWLRAVHSKCSMKTRPIENLCYEFRWVEEIVRSRLPTHLFSSARRSPPRSTDKYSAPIMGQASGIAYEDWTRPLSSHADARLLRLRAPGGLYARRGSSGRLFQSRLFEPT